MKVVLSYGYRPFTTAVYFEKAFSVENDVMYFGPPWGDRAGYLPNHSIVDVMETGKLSLDCFVFIEPGCGFFPKGIETLKVPTACYLVDVHTDIWVRELYAPFFDYIFLAQKDYVDHFKKLGHKNVFWLPLACDEDIHGEIKSERIYDVGFVGKPGFNPQHERAVILDMLSNNFKMNDFTKFYPKEEITKIYSQSKIVVNIPYNNDVNMRLFEALAGGSLLITKRIPNGQNELFKDGETLVEYTSEEDLQEKVKYYLEHEDERLKIASAGQKLALSQHTYKNRVDQLMATIMQSETSPETALVRAMTPLEIHAAYARIYNMFRLADPILDEIAEAKEEEVSVLGLYKELGKSLLRRINTITPFTRNARKNRRKNN
jgi:hypothetical protein